MNKSIVLVLVCLMVAIGLVACGGGGGGAAGGPTYDNSKANGTFSVFMLDGAGGFSTERGIVTFNGAGSGVYTSLTTTDTMAFTYTVTVPGNTITIDGTMVGTLNAAGNFFTAADVAGGSVMMMYGVKNATAYTDMTVTFVGGSFEHPGPTTADLFTVVTATPTPGLLTYSGLTGSGPSAYDIISNGTFTIDPAGTADTFGAISGDKNFMVFGSATAAAVALKLPGSGMSLASLNGTYKAYDFMDDTVTGGGAYSASRYTLTFNGSGSGTWTIEASSTGGVGSGVFSYTVDPTGLVTIDGNMFGAALQDGSVIGVMDPYSAGDDTISSMIAIKQ